MKTKNLNVLLQGLPAKKKRKLAEFFIDLKLVGIMEHVLCESTNRNFIIKLNITFIPERSSQMIFPHLTPVREVIMQNDGTVSVNVSLFPSSNNK